jgi:hypothetical protein
MMSPPFNRQIFNITADELRDIICDYKRKESENEDKDARLQGRIAAIFVILVVSTAAAVMPLLFKRFQRHKIVLWLYDFARYVGSGIIISAAFFQYVPSAVDLSSL